MPEKRMLIVDDELLGRIDENRGEMSRNEFLLFLINNQMQEKESSPTTNKYVSREEYAEFTQGMKELLRHFFDFFIKDGLKQEDPEITVAFHFKDQAQKSQIDVFINPNRFKQVY
jgi:hypothetical protein